MSRDRIAFCASENWTWVSSASFQASVVVDFLDQQLQHPFLLGRQQHVPDGIEGFKRPGQLLAIDRLRI